MQKKIYFIFTFLISLFINCFCVALIPMNIQPCNHENKSYIIRTFDENGENDEQLLDFQNLCSECTIDFVKKYLKDYVGTPFLVKYCGFYNIDSDGNEQLNINEKLKGYVCKAEKCKCKDSVIFIDDEIYRIFNLKWGFNYLPRALCVRKGHQQKVFEIEPIDQNDVI